MLTDISYQIARGTRNSTGILIAPKPRRLIGVVSSAIPIPNRGVSPSEFQQEIRLSDDGQLGNSLLSSSPSSMPPVFLNVGSLKRPQNPAPNPPTPTYDTQVAYQPQQSMHDMSTARRNLNMYDFYDDGSNATCWGMAKSI